MWCFDGHLFGFEKYATNLNFIFPLFPFWFFTTCQGEASSRPGFPIRSTFFFFAEQSVTTLPHGVEASNADSLRE
jgi:hypothetical protein